LSRKPSVSRRWLTICSTESRISSKARYPKPSTRVFVQPGPEAGHRTMRFAELKFTETGGLGTLGVADSRPRSSGLPERAKLHRTAPTPQWKGRMTTVSNSPAWL
jgi:hypothetical protein